MVFPRRFFPLDQSGSVATATLRLDRACSQSTQTKRPGGRGDSFLDEVISCTSVLVRSAYKY